MKRKRKRKDSSEESDNTMLDLRRRDLHEDHDHLGLGHIEPLGTEWGCAFLLVYDVTLGLMFGRLRSSHSVQDGKPDHGLGFQTHPINKLPRLQLHLIGHLGVKGEEAETADAGFDVGASEGGHLPELPRHLDGFMEQQTELPLLSASDWQPKRLQKSKGRTTQSSMVDTLLRLIETASGTNGLRNALAGDREEEDKEGEEDEEKRESKSK
ncbi:hypothetical protein EYF80_021252 [Liparis tanakae]|uniref:Uncharacterized protein n=1 Tax=Liparis tanakae TaxID=230148 RepID=A0A4Z2HRX8_9TELE|nr:hypothetical protein EYF80_021252 [Liparis tanakae]